MAEAGVRYTVTVAKQGNGAAEAAAEMQSLSRAAAATNAGLNASNAQLSTLTATSKATTTTLRAMGGVLTLAGLQQFPQLTTAAMLTKSSLDAVRASGANLTMGFGMMTAGVAGLAAAIVSATFAWQAYSAEQANVASQKALTEQTQRFNAELRERVKLMREAKQITNEQSDMLMRQLYSPTTGGNQGVRDFVGGVEKGSAQDRLTGQANTFRFADASRALAESGGMAVMNKTEQRTQIQKRYNEEIALQNDLVKEGLITEQQRMQLGSEADIKRMQSLTQLNVQLTETQQLVKAGTELFASGLASAIVDTFRGGEKAMQKFASNFLAQLAQMIIQAQILKALSAFGFAANGTVRMAALGGTYPQLMAAGGVAGVHDVSNATYFPKFNVVAGEAGREMLTVLARPRFMEVGGMQAVVGNAGPNRLAITSADELEASADGGGGRGVILIGLQPGLEGTIVENSIKGAVIKVTQDMGRDSDLRRATRKV